MLKNTDTLIACHRLVSSGVGATKQLSDTEDHLMLKYTTVENKEYVEITLFVISGEITVITSSGKAKFEKSTYDANPDYQLLLKMLLRIIEQMSQARSDSIVGTIKSFLKGNR